MTLYEPLAFVYVLEGPDHAGKTTTAAQISKVAREEGHNVRTVHFGPPAPTLLPYELFQLYVDAVAQAAHEAVTDNVVTIFDRLHIGEWVYGPMMRDRSLLTHTQIIAVDQMLDSIGAKKIHVTARFVTLRERHLAQGDDYVSTVAQLGSIRQRYLDTLRNPRLRGWVVLDTTFTVAPS